QLPVAVDHRQPVQRPAFDGLGGDAGDLGFRHARIMLQFQRRKPAFLVTAKPAKRHHGADVGSPGGQRGNLGGGVEIAGLDTHDRNGGRHGRQPPVMGGNRAISRAPATFSWWSTWSWSMATRITSGCRSAFSYSSPRDLSQ